MLLRLLVLQLVQQAAVAAHRVKSKQQNSTRAPAANSKQYNHTLSPSPRVLAALASVQAVPVGKVAHSCNIIQMGRARWSYSSSPASSQAARAAENQAATAVAVEVAALKSVLQARLPVLQWRSPAAAQAAAGPATQVRC